MSHSSYFLERNMLTSYVGPLTQTRIGVSSVTVLSTGPVSGQYVFLIPKSRNVYIFSIFSYTYNDSAFYFTEIIVLISLEGDNKPLISLKLVFLLFWRVP